MVPLKREPWRRGCDLDDPLLIDRKFRAGVAPRPSLAAGRRLRIGCLLHAARLDVRPRRPALEPCDLVTQRRHHSVQLRQIFALLHHQALELGLRQAIKISGRRINGRRHAHVESDLRRLGNLIIIPPPPPLLPLLHF